SPRGGPDLARAHRRRTRSEPAPPRPALREPLRAATSARCRGRADDPPGGWLRRGRSGHEGALSHHRPARDRRYAAAPVLASFVQSSDAPSRPGARSAEPDGRGAAAPGFDLLPARDGRSAMSACLLSDVALVEARTPEDL